MHRSHVIKSAKWAVLICLLVITSCTTDYVTGKRTFSLVSESQETALGKEADPQIIAEYGLYNDSALSSFVSNLGQSLAKVSHRSQLSYTFRVVDSPIVNAFALPGGYVYITRGILAHFNSEDELAGVIGHEIAHVVARHSAEQMSRQQLVGLGLGVGSLVSETFAQYANVAGAGLGLLLLRYSRDQESESDRLGVEYSTKVGYDAHRMAEFFRTLGRMSEDSGQSLPSFMSTHPDPGDREAEVGRLAGEWQKKVAYNPRNVSRYDYLKRLDGMVYGNDPRQGFVENQTFYHPQLRFQFPIPAGWQLSNSASSVLMIDSEKKAAIKLTLGQADSPQQEADKFLANEGVSVRRREATTVHGYSAVVVESVVKGNDGDLGVLSYFIKKGEHVYVFHGFTAEAVYRNYAVSFGRVMGGFEDVSDPAVINKQPRRLRIKKAPRSGDVATVLRTLGTDQESLSELALANGMSLNDRIEQGTWVKVVGD